MLKIILVLLVSLGWFATAPAAAGEPQELAVGPNDDICSEGAAAIKRRLRPLLVDWGRKNLDWEKVGEVYDPATLEYVFISCHPHPSVNHMK